LNKVSGGLQNLQAMNNRVTFKEMLQQIALEAIPLAAPG
jgi:hypothetical protein